VGKHPDDQQPPAQNQNQPEQQTEILTAGQVTQQYRMLPQVVNAGHSRETIGVTADDFAQHGVNLAAVRAHNQQAFNQAFNRVFNQNNNQ